jgi:anti-sigma B factor antagonist
MAINTSTDSSGEIIIVHFPVRLTSDVSDEYKKFFRKVVEEEKGKIVVDLTSTEYLDSSGLGAIVSRIAAIRALKGDIRLAGAGEFVLNMLELTHLNKILNNYNLVETAVQSFKEEY